MKKKELIEKLLKYDEKFKKMKIQMKGLKDNNSALAHKLQRKSHEG